MATKAQQFRHEQERSGPKRPKQVKRVRHVDVAARNDSTRADRRPGVVLEEVLDGGKPSRKSTRRSSHRGRNDTELMRAARTRSLTPKARAQRAQAARH